MAYGTKIEKLKSEEGQGFVSKNILKLEPGKKYVIRILPSRDGENTFYDAYVHFGLGMPFLCPKRSGGQSCPVCDFVNTTIKKDKTLTEEQLRELKSLYPKKRVYMNVYVRSENSADGEVKIWNVPKTTADMIYNLILSPEYGDITNTDTGFDLNVFSEKQKGMLFPKVNIMPRRRESPLAETPQKIEEIMNQYIDMKGIVPLISKQEIIDRLKSYIENKNEQEVQKEPQNNEEEVEESMVPHSFSDDGDVPF